ncbi:prolipoprotein diacylglyceryl transferase [Patescibacteria group bacterium]|nr:MAG: prolipoprotein diacylglyceryl transferase [Patescibacteria group bacterium]
MIPYFHWETIALGPLTLHVWGLFVALGAILGIFLARRAARSSGLNPEVVTDAAVWLVVAGLLGGRLGYILFYNPGPFFVDPWELFRVWNGGLSSTGGFLGALAALSFFARRRKIDALKLTDALAFGFPFGWAVGRLGCFFTHLHPGILSGSFIAVRYPGGSRLDMGLIESLVAFLIGLLVFVRSDHLGRSDLDASRKGAATFTVVWSYLIVRFFLDFLRARDLSGSDLRVWGLLTPAQLGAVALLALSFFWFFHRREQ